MWTEVYFSDDAGRTWDFLSRVNDFGSPGSMVQLPDGRLVMVYGYRLMPSGIRAKVSDDEGRTWGPELIVRDDGGSWDLGYPNAWVTDDGKVGVIYYFNSKDDPVAGERRQAPYPALDLLGRLMLSRRLALVGGSAAGVMLGASAARAQSAAILFRTDQKPVRVTGAEHFVVYRNEREFAAWPFYCGLWQTADGSVVAGFKRVPSDYGQPATSTTPT
jgi:hypothetical protein